MKPIVVLAVLLATMVCVVLGALPPSPISDERIRTFYDNFIFNLKFSGTDAIVAARTDYYQYNWERDAALCMHGLMKFAPISEYERIGWYERYFGWTVKSLNQTGVDGFDIRGEPKFYPNGKAYDGPWGRPQNDGPPLRALVLIKYANEILAKTNNVNDIINRLYYPSHATNSGIQYDLDYICDTYQDRSFELWEEVVGNHFGVLLVNRRALEAGAVLASKLGDIDGASRYASIANIITQKLEEYYDGCRNLIVPTFNHDNHPIAVNKHDLDVAVYLNSLYGTEDVYEYKNPTSFHPTDERVLATLIKLENGFYEEYQINKHDEAVVRGVLLGRYPNDIYDGHGMSTGNPWFLTTAAAAEVYYIHSTQLLRAAKNNDGITFSNRIREYLNALVSYAANDNDANVMRQFVQQLPEYQCHGNVVSTVLSKDEMMAFARAMVNKGDAIMARFNRHVTTDSALSEQINRDTGYQQGVEHLTWSYSNALNAMHTRSLIPL